MSKFAVLVVGYNRLHGVKRLLDSLLRVEFDHDAVDLIISLDNSGCTDIVNFANGFDWPFGQKIVRTFEERQGLRKHILQCGDYLLTYEAIAVLEDDLIVAPSLYRFFKAAYDFYHADKNIAGISLYSHRRNHLTGETFTPAYNGSDVYFMQYAQSWGQIWFREQWFAFKNWYQNNSEEFGYEPDLPRNICEWAKSSWLKYHIKYCIKCNKYFVYPYYSLTTCCSDAGEHTNNTSNLLQVPFMEMGNREYKFVDLISQSAIKYDAFFERTDLGKFVSLAEDELTVDLYGTKEQINTKYLLSSKMLNYKILQSYARQLRPQEENIINDVQGDSFFLYDTACVEDREQKQPDKNQRFVYYYNLCSNTREIVKLAMYRLWQVLKGKKRLRHK